MDVLGSAGRRTEVPPTSSYWSGWLSCQAKNLSIVQPSHVGPDTEYPLRLHSYAGFGIRFRLSAALSTCSGNRSLLKMLELRMRNRIE